MSDIKRGQAAAHLPPEVAVRVIAHRVADRHVAVEAVEGQPGTYEMVPDRDGSGQLAAYEFATRMVNRAFVDSEASGGTAPTGDEDASWSIQFSFQRTPEAAAWDQRIFDCGNVLFQAMRAKEKDKLGRDKGWLTSSLRSTNKTLAELHRHTGNPAIGAAINLVNSFIDETPQGAKAAARQGRATTAYTSERSRMVGRMAAAVMLDLLDLGNDRLTQRPGHPGSDADLRDWRHLWLVRNTCLVALALKEDRTLPKLGHPDEDSMSRTLLIGAAGLRDLSDEDDSDERAEEFAVGHQTMTRLIGEIPFASEQQVRHEECDEVEAEEALLAAADAVLEVIEHLFPPICPVKSRLRAQEASTALVPASPSL